MTLSWCSIRAAPWGCSSNASVGMFDIRCSFQSKLAARDTLHHVNHSSLKANSCLNGMRNKFIAGIACAHLIIRCSFIKYEALKSFHICAKEAQCLQIMQLQSIYIDGSEVQMQCAFLLPQRSTLIFLI